MDLFKAPEGSMRDSGPRLAQGPGPQHSPGESCDSRGGYATTIIRKLKKTSVLKVGINPALHFLPPLVAGLEAHAERLGLSPAHDTAHVDPG
jgi:hypothetical protein